MIGYRSQFNSRAKILKIPNFETIYCNNIIGGVNHPLISLADHFFAPRLVNKVLTQTLICIP
jgi:hypothetical protein